MDAVEVSMEVSQHPIDGVFHTSIREARVTNSTVIRQWTTIPSQPLDYLDVLTRRLLRGPVPESRRHMQSRRSRLHRLWVQKYPHLDDLQII